MTDVSVRYVGTKPLKRDTVTGSLAMWVGQGSVCDVPESVAVKLFLYPDVWQPANAPVIERPVAPPAAEIEAEEEEGEVVLEGEEDNEVRPEDASGLELPPTPAGAVTVDEVMQVFSLLDRETDFTESGKPAVAKVRDRFPGRDVTLATVREAWDRFSGA